MSAPNVKPTTRVGFNWRPCLKRIFISPPGKLFQIFCAVFVLVAWLMYQSGFVTNFNEVVCRHWPVFEPVDSFRTIDALGVELFFRKGEHLELLAVDICGNGFTAQSTGRVWKLVLVLVV